MNWLEKHCGYDKTLEFLKSRLANILSIKLYFPNKAEHSKAPKSSVTDSLTKKAIETFLL